MHRKIERPCSSRENARQAQWIALVSYFLIAFAWTWSCWCALYAASQNDVSLAVRDSRLATLGQFGPFVAALVVTAFVDGRSGVRALLGRLVRWRANPVWVVVSLFLLPATMLAAIALYAWLNGSLGTLRFREPWSTLPMHFLYLLMVGGPLGEEPGWRGFALPRLLAQVGSVSANLLLGMVHAVWHLPLWWLSLDPCPFWLYLIGVILLTFLFTWVFNHTRGSVFYALLFHTSLSIASMRLPEAPAYHVWVLCLAVVVAALICFDRQGLLQTTAE